MVIGYLTAFGLFGLLCGVLRGFSSPALTYLLTALFGYCVLVCIGWLAYLCKGILKIFYIFIIFCLTIYYYVI